MRLLPIALAAVVVAATPAFADHDRGKGRGHQGPKPARPAAVDPCKGDPGAVRSLRLTVKGQPADARYAVPRGTPRGIVVFDHGYSHTMRSWDRHMSRIAAQLGVIAVTPDYRGQRNDLSAKPLPTSRGWRVQEGAEDSIAVAQHFERVCTPTGINVIYGVSMGGNTSGLVLAAQPKDLKGKPLFDYWVDVEGAANVTETYLVARQLALVNTFAANAVADIEEAFGGSLEEVPDVYAERTVVNRVDDIAASGVKGVVMVHGVADGLVTHDESRQLQALLLAEGVPVDMTAFVTRSSGSEAGTTIDGYAPTGQQSPFAGHASEASETHDVGNAGFAALAKIYETGKVTCGERVVDGTVPVSPYASLPC